MHRGFLPFNIQNPDFQKTMFLISCNWLQAITRWTKKIFIGINHDTILGGLLNCFRSVRTANKCTEKHWTSARVKIIRKHFTHRDSVDSWEFVWTICDNFTLSVDLVPNHYIYRKFGNKSPNVIRNQFSMLSFTKFHQSENILRA